MAIDAVLLDVGGVFHLPDHEIIRTAFERAEVTVDPAVLDRAHYEAATCFTTDYQGELPWQPMWLAYVERYARACGVADDDLEEACRHLDAEFTTAAPWRRCIPGAVDALRALERTGVALGVVSNADGTAAERLRAQEVLQVGPGPGVEVQVLLDSGVVGIDKPDPRIFTMALDALEVPAERAVYVGDMPGIDVVGARRAAIRPLVMDPYGLHDGADYETVASLLDVRDLVLAARSNPRAARPQLAAAGSA